MERLTTNIVPFDGPLEAEMCFLGEAPGGDEDNALKPFVGAAGQLLDRCFRTVGIARGEVLLGNIFKQRPPNNSIKYYFQDSKCTKPTWEGEEHIASLKSWLEKRKKEGNINVLVALGAIPTFVLTGKKRITKWRGSVLPCTLVEGFKVYCCFHPSHVNRLMNEPEERLLGEKKKQQQNALPLFLRDLERVVEQSSSPDFKHPEREFTIIENARDAIRALELLSNVSYVAVDIETLFSDEGPLLWCIGFSPSPEKAFIIPFLKGRRFFWSLPEEVRVLQAISKLFLNEGVKKIFHNCLFDLSVLGRYYGLRCATGSVEDSMLCYHASYPYLKKALETLTSIYTWENYYKDDGKVWDGRRISDEAEFIYNGRDCGVTREIWPLVERDAKELGTWEGYRRTMSVIPSLLAMQIGGVNINIEKKKELQRIFGEKVVEAERLLVESTGQSWNLNSSPQMIRLVYGYLGMPMQYNHKTKKPTTDKDALNRLRKKHPENKVLKAIVDHRKFSKLSNTYAKMKVEKDNRIRTSYSFISTYRLSSSESIFGGGGNLQNIPVRTVEGKLVRSLFIPDEGLVLLASDLAQAEARVVAWLSNDTRMIEAFLAGEDIHWMNAKMIFQIPDSVNYLPDALWRDSFTNQEHPLEFYRRLGKSVVFASFYGMGFGMLQTILIREEVYFQAALCKRLLHQYLTNNPMLVSWQNNTKEEVRASRTLTSPSPFNRKRVFRGRLSDNLFRSALAFRPQSVVGEILEVAIQKIHATSGIFRPLLNVHDEVVGQCRREDIPAAMKEAKSALEIPLQINNRELVIPCDFKTGSDWGNLKEIAYKFTDKRDIWKAKADLINSKNESM